MKKLFFVILLIISNSFVCINLYAVELTNSAKSQTCESVDGSGIDMACIEDQLKSKDGLGGWVHASVKDQMILVFTWRNPNNFFINLQLPMSSKDPMVMAELLKLKRHDRIVVKGSFYSNDAPIQHINVKEVQVIEAYTGPSEDYEYDQNLPIQILTSTSLIGKVHATANGGSVLVVEVGDRVYPVFNKKPELATKLYRNDKIKIAYNVQFFPTQPSHLELDVDAAQPIEVLEEIAIGNAEPISLTGPLVMFPQSPQILFDVYALRTEDADGVKRNYTLVNFTDADLFKKIREKLESAWTSMSAEAKYDRNKYINYKIMVEASGTKNVVSPVQANPQILINDINDLKITIL